MTETTILAILAISGTILTGAISSIATIIAAKQKPQVVNHQCRISKLNVYTYITGSKRQTPPACVWLDPHDHISCCYTPPANTPHVEMKENSRGKCYLAVHAQKYKLK